MVYQRKSPYFVQKSCSWGPQVIAGSFRSKQANSVVCDPSGTRHETRILLKLNFPENVARHLVRDVGQGAQPNDRRVSARIISKRVRAVRYLLKDRFGGSRRSVRVEIEVFAPSPALPHFLWPGATTSYRWGPNVRQWLWLHPFAKMAHSVRHVVLEASR